MNCPKCNAPMADNAAFCESCGAEVQQSVEEKITPTPLQKPENIFTGIVGALLGAVLGAGSIILLSQLGFVASVSGLILAVCTLKGYELLGGRLSTCGIVVSVVLVLITPYLADRLDWAIVVMNEFPELTFGEAFNALPLLLAEEVIEIGDYLKNLLLLYVFAGIGAVGTLWRAIKKN